MSVTTVRELIVRSWTRTARLRGRVGVTAPSRPAWDDIEVTVIDVTLPGEERIGPGGAAFGTLVHAVLAQAPFDATRAGAGEDC